MYPAPTSATFFGSVSMSKKPSLFVPYSAPGICGGTVGLPPTATKIRFALTTALVPSSSVTSTWLRDSSFAQPCTYSTLSLVRLRS
ncbi:hypothetical protein MFIFM68171_03708 [Madurella fahalii]|uniref:Uncharacterized protein n=1 Tax=Madurella fahalii TaxID=1157608 RepID=A0ABQ0G6W1_9PEZI